MGIKNPIYLDNNATTPVDPRVFEAMRPYFCEIFGNPASGAHSFGWQAEEAVHQARRSVAELIHASEREIVWTSGTTESINTALLGVAASYREKGNRIITCVTEHKAVLETARYLERNGFQVTTLPVDESGYLDPEDVRRAISDKTILISLLAANNEIGVLHPLVEIGRIAKEKGVLFHVDAAQACGKIPIDVETTGIDLLSMSAHKVYGPKGIGALYIRSRNPHVRLEPLIHGGGQERGMRGGTLAVPNIVGMGAAFEIAGKEMREETERVKTLRDRLYKGLREGSDGVFLNGPLLQKEARLSGNLNVSFPPLKAGDLMAKVSEIAVSSGSACASGSLEPSYVLMALGSGEARARSSIRFGIGRFNTEEEIDFTIQKIVETVRYLRSP